MKIVFLAHAEQDRDFAARLAQFLESGCNVHCAHEEGAIAPGGSVIDKAEEGLSADVLVLLLSEHSWPQRLPRERWERVLFDEPANLNVEVVTILLAECPFPQLLRRRNFFDATADRLTAMRLLKRWVWRWEQGATHSLNTKFSADLEDLYRALADVPATLYVSGPDASRFAKEAAQEFEAVVWIPCHGRTLAQIAGELGSQLGLVLDGELQENCRRIRNLLDSRRLLLVLDAPSPDLAQELTTQGRTSTLITSDPVSVSETPQSLAYARKLIVHRRYAEAYELLHSLLDSEISPADCARELTWICEHWNRPGESESLRTHYRLPPEEQLSLF